MLQMLEEMTFCKKLYGEDVSNPGGRKDSTFMGDGQVNGNPPKMEIDSGASHTVVNRDLISQPT